MLDNEIQDAESPQEEVNEFVSEEPEGEAAIADAGDDIGDEHPEDSGGQAEAPDAEAPEEVAPQGLDATQLVLAKAYDVPVDLLESLPAEARGQVLKAFMSKGQAKPEMQEKTASPPADAPKPIQPLQVELPELTEDQLEDMPVVAKLTGETKKVAEYINEFSNAVGQAFGFVAQVLNRLEVAENNRELDSYISGLGPEYGDIFKGEAGAKNKQSLRDMVGRLGQALGGKATREELFKAALGAAFSDQVKTIARKEITNKVKARNNQAIGRTNAANVKKAAGGEDRAKSRVEEWLKANAAFLED